MLIEPISMPLLIISTCSLLLCSAKRYKAGQLCASSLYQHQNNWAGWGIVSRVFSSVTLGSCGYHRVMISAFSIETIALNAIPLILAITIHEAAHGYIAKRLRDNTTYLLGRVTLHTLKHIDLVGTVLMPLANLLFYIPFFKINPQPFHQHNLFFLLMELWVSQALS